MVIASCMSYIEFINTCMSWDSFIKKKTIGRQPFDNTNSISSSPVALFSLSSWPHALAFTIPKGTNKR
jgi:hypothetical protein